MDYIKEIDFENNIIKLSNDASIKTVSAQGENSLLITFSISDKAQEKKSSTTSNFEDEQLPSVEDIMEYLHTKKYYSHDNAELQKHFLGRVLNSREERQLYYKFRSIVKKAKNILAEADEGMWIDAGYRSIETGKVKITRLDSIHDYPERMDD